MKQSIILLHEMIKLIEECNRKAGQSLILEESNRPAFRIRISYPDSDNPYREKSIQGIYVSVIIIYESGGSEESSITENDTIDFIITDSAITQIIFQENMGIERTYPDFRIEESGIKKFLKECKSFCYTRIQKPGFDI
jgi:hypothetical protein